MFFRSPYADALIVILIVLLFFGPKRLPGLGKSLGQGMREFKDSITGKSEDPEEDQAQLQAAPPPPAESRAAEPASVSAPVEPSRTEGAPEPRS
jgi:sec-independent protein translocase protein TatA